MPPKRQEDIVLFEAPYYLILSSGKIITATFLLQEKNEEANEVEKIIAILKW